MLLCTWFSSFMPNLKFLAQTYHIGELWKEGVGRITFSIAHRDAKRWTEKLM